jgi:diaminopimelate epimerase
MDDDKTRSLPFSKMHGAGNDYVYVDGIGGRVPEDAPALSIRVSDRHKGIGSDGLVYLLPSTVADVRMRMWNADGSEAEMCGNAVRCVGKLAYERGYAKTTRVVVETMSGLKTLELNVEKGKVVSARVYMGVPVFEPARIPVLSGPIATTFFSQTVVVDDHGFELSCVSMGNPHAVIFVDDVSAYPIGEWGPKLEHHTIFPKRANIEFVQMISSDHVKARVWERGSGETQACGTGACAIAVLCATLGRTGRHVVVDLPGGSLTIDWDMDGKVYLTGPSEHVFDGSFEL